jgi:2-polyprenyl-3-methyl-5-hydroxy-6-metoxy-1,4-benzoquinol methylase
MSLSVYANNKLKSKVRNDAWSKLLELVPENSIVLDVGCSSGNFGAELKKKKNCHVTGIDINQDDLALANKVLDKTSLVNIENDDLGSLGSFDVIVCADVLEHLINPVSALEKLQNLLSKDGAIVYSIPNMANIATRLELLKGRFQYTEYGLLDETHLHYYDHEEVSKIFREAGLIINRSDNTIRDIPPAVIKKSLKEIGLTPSDKFFAISSDIEAITFQFIGTAKSTGASQPHSTSTPYDFMSSEFDRVLRAHDDEKALLLEENLVTKAQVTELISENRLQVKDALDIKHELEQIKNSRSWKLVQKVVKLKSALLRN